MKRAIVVDFETASPADLKRAGAWVYSQHPDTEILCLCWADVRNPRNIGQWVPGTSPLPLMDLARDPDVGFIAHNVLFEKAIWRNIMMPSHGVPDVPDGRWHDTMAVCAQKGLPLALDGALAALGLEPKDKEGSRFTVGLSKPDKKGNRIYPEGYLARVLRYCHKDVQDEIALFKRIGGLEDGEREVWLLDQTINQRGVKLDIRFIQCAQRIVDDATGPLLERFRELTGVRPTMVAKFLAWLAARGLHLDNLQKGTVDIILGRDEYGVPPEEWEEYVEIPEDVREALRIRQVAGSAAVKKLPAMLDCADDRGIARNLLQYHGASTGRWAGRLLQPQNFPRGTIHQTTWGDELTVDHKVNSIMTGDWRTVRDICGPPVETVVGSLRHAIIARPGKTFVVGDYAGIEARIVLALAGQHDKARLMASGADTYCDMATQIFGYDVNKKDHPEERTIGKNTVLGCGFGMGADKFHARYCPDRPVEFARKVIEAYRFEWAPKVRFLWQWLEARASRKFWPDDYERILNIIRKRNEKTPDPFDIEGLERCISVDIVGNNDWLTVRLPSGRRLWYAQPKPVKKLIPYDLDKPAWADRVEKGRASWKHYDFLTMVNEFVLDRFHQDLKTLAEATRDQSDVIKALEREFPDYILTNMTYTYMTSKNGRWEHITGYGGQVTENVVQALARDLLVDAMKKCEAAGLPVVLTVHDEIVCEAEKSDLLVDRLKQIMEDRPQWAVDLGIPVTAECWSGERYRK